jgi:hypothetical protein
VAEIQANIANQLHVRHSSEKRRAESGRTDG